MSRETTKRLRVQLDVVVEFPEDLRRLPITAREDLAALHEGLRETIGRICDVEIKPVSGHHTIGLDYRPEKKPKRGRGIPPAMIELLQDDAARAALNKYPSPDPFDPRAVEAAVATKIGRDLLTKTGKP